MATVLENQGQTKKASNSKQVTNQLVVCHPNPDLLERLEGILPEAQILPCQQADWHDTLAEQIQQFDGLKEIVLVGDSTAFSAFDPHDPNSEPSGPAKSFVARVQTAAKERQAAQKHFADEMQYLASTPALKEKLQKGELKLIGLFYRCEINSFASYRLDNGQFEVV